MKSKQPGTHLLSRRLEFVPFKSCSALCASSERFRIVESKHDKWKDVESSEIETEFLPTVPRIAFHPPVERFCVFWPTQMIASRERRLHLSPSSPQSTSLNLMLLPNLIYVIPPYLLNTCLGRELHQQLSLVDPELASTNFFPTSSHTYRFRRPGDLKDNPLSFCDDPAVDLAIKKNLKRKFAVLGVLGCAPNDEISDEYLFELYDMFKHRLLLASPERRDQDEDLAIGTVRDSTGASASATNLPATKSQSSTSSKSKKSVFEVFRYGEVIMLPETESTSNMEDKPLDALLAFALEIKETRLSFYPYLMIDDRRAYLTPLPMYWTPICSERSLYILENKFSMGIDLENGLSLLKFSLNKDLDAAPEEIPRKKQFYNFITNNELNEKVGVFYYEVTVEQTSTQNTDHKSIILANDSSLSSSSSLYFNMGFTKQNVKIDVVPSGSQASLDLNVDLKAIQKNLSSSGSASIVDDDILTFLGSEPGVSFEGSIALSFNNSLSYASIKSSESTYRTMNRRFSQLNRHLPNEPETNKLDIDFPFNTISEDEPNGSKRYSTDVVGFGINFVDQSLFITLNGILVKTVSHTEICSSNTNHNSIFAVGKDEAIYPMIGFQLADLDCSAAGSQPPETRVITNFGQSPFKFNMSNYVSHLKENAEVELNTLISDEMRSAENPLTKNKEHNEFENAVCNLKDDSALLNDFIKGYLVQEGFLKTFDSFEFDLDDLSKNTYQLSNGDRPTTSFHAMDVLAQSTRAVERQHVRRLVLDRKFLEAAEALATLIHNSEKLNNLVFELELLQYIDLLRRFVSVKGGTVVNFFTDTKENEAALFEEAFFLGKRLMKKSQGSRATQEALGDLSTILLTGVDGKLTMLTQVKRILSNQTADLYTLADLVNTEILREQGIEDQSRLEHMINRVEANIDALSSESNQFKLLNFDHDYLDAR